MNAAKPTILLVDDEPTIITALEYRAQSAGFDVATATSGSSGILLSRQRPPDVAMVDVRLPGVTGLDVLRAIRQNAPECAVIMISGLTTVETAVQAIKCGACDYLSKPLDFGRIDGVLADVKSRVAQRQSEILAREAHARDSLGMVGDSAAMCRLRGDIHRLGRYLRTALISGETGTGKELVARALHRASPRAHKPFVTINCSGVVEPLFESKLFGHARGAFTGGYETGLFETADRGVLFLDEVAELPLGLQSKLLRALEFGEIQRVGSIAARRVDVAVIASTNRDLRSEVAAGRFRRDLYYRLNMLELQLPPLRERREDIPVLADTFASDCASHWNRTVPEFTPAALELLVQSPWEGNVRELRNVVERAFLIADGPRITEQVVQSSLPASEREVPPMRAAPDTPAVVQKVRDEDAVSPLCAVERHHIVRALEHVKGNKKAAARLLGVSRRGLYRRLDRLGLDSTVARRPTRTPTAGQPDCSPKDIE